MRRKLYAFGEKETRQIGGRRGDLLYASHLSKYKRPIYITFLKVYLYVVKGGRVRVAAEGDTLCEMCNHLATTLSQCHGFYVLTVRP